MIFEYRRYTADICKGNVHANRKLASIRVLVVSIIAIHFLVLIAFPLIFSHLVAPRIVDLAVIRNKKGQHGNIGNTTYRHNILKRLIVPVLGGSNVSDIRNESLAEETTVFSERKDI